MRSVTNELTVVRLKNATTRMTPVTISARERRGGGGGAARPARGSSSKRSLTVVLQCRGQQLEQLRHQVGPAHDGLVVVVGSQAQGTVRRSVTRRPCDDADLLPVGVLAGELLGSGRVLGDLPV